MATWKKILVEGDAVVSNLATANLSATSSVRTFSLADGASLFAFKDDDANDLFSIVVTADNAATTSLSGGMQIIEDGASPANQGCLKLFAADPNSSYVCLMADGSATGSQTITFPAAGPTGANQILESDASGNLSWIATPSGGGVTIDNYADTRLLTAGSSSSNIDAESALTFDGLTLTVTGQIEYDADANARTGEIYDAKDSGRYATNANVTAGDLHVWPKTGSVTAFKIYTLNGTTQTPELLNASTSSTNINQIAGLCPITNSVGDRFYVRCMATIPASSVNGTFSSGDAGDPVFLDPSNPGELTLTEPASGAFVRQMGYILSQTTISSTTYYVIWFDPSPNYIRV